MHKFCLLWLVTWLVTTGFPGAWFVSIQLFTLLVAALMQLPRRIKMLDKYVLGERLPKLKLLRKELLIDELVSLEKECRLTRFRRAGFFSQSTLGAPDAKRQKTE